MKVGDLVKYFATGDIAVIIDQPNEGGTVKVFLSDGSSTWFVTSQCKVINESR